jgi:uncharacterized protein (DUF433 family)
MTKTVYPGVTVNNQVQFGRPCIKGTGISTAIIASRFKAGEYVGQIAMDYKIPPYKVEDALRWECLSRRSQLRRTDKAFGGDGR